MIGKDILQNNQLPKPNEFRKWFLYNNAMEEYFTVNKAKIKQLYTDYLEGDNKLLRMQDIEQMVTSK